jgi:hypothetical protein
MAARLGAPRHLRRRHAIVKEHSGAYGMGVDYAYTMVHKADERVKHGPRLAPVAADGRTPSAGRVRLNPPGPDRSRPLAYEPVPIRRRAVGRRRGRLGLPAPKEGAKA